VPVVLVGFKVKPTIFADVRHPDTPLDVKSTAAPSSLHFFQDGILEVTFKTDLSL